MIYDGTCGIDIVYIIYRFGIIKAFEGRKEALSCITNKRILGDD